MCVHPSDCPESRPPPEKLPSAFLAATNSLSVGFHGNPFISLSFLRAGFVGCRVVSVTSSALSRPFPCLLASVSAESAVTLVGPQEVTSRLFPSAAFPIVSLL